jgi:hypothetical protein
MERSGPEAKLARQSLWFRPCHAASKSMFPQSQFEGSYCQASTLSKMEPINIPEGKKLSGSSASGRDRMQ